MSFVGIYDADGGLGGELRYVAGKLLGRGKCALCDITHGWNPMGSRSWKQACAVSDVDLELLHRDEATAEQLAATTALPTILRGDDGQWSEIVPADEIAQFVGAPDALLERLGAL
ncbi:hypothetical protein [Candidatus Poriferisocius sp.]|uniref:hypothetical protein n=1 Tax=Candidatus Poriferisocius sp. TaxID=3101276 RepID=UPI003B01B771